MLSPHCLAGGRWLAYSAELANAGAGTPRGLWRQRLDERPQILALLHASTAIGEAEPGRRWHDFIDFAILANGEVVLHAGTDPGPRTDVWLLSPGRAARRWLSAGDPVSVPTEVGSQTAIVTGYTLAASGPGMGSGRNPEIGADGWVATDGSLLLRATTVQHGDLLLSTRVDVQRVFADGFEQARRLPDTPAPRDGGRAPHAGGHPAHRHAPTTRSASLQCRPGLPRWKASANSVTLPRGMTMGLRRKGGAVRLRERSRHRPSGCHTATANPRAYPRGPAAPRRGWPYGVAQVGGISSEGWVS